MRLQRLSNAQNILLEMHTPLGAGGEAKVYAIRGDTNHVVKIYHELPPDQVLKLRTMIANPPEDPTLASGHLSIAFPIDLVALASKPDQVIGFLMQRATGTAPLFHFYNPSTRRQDYPLVNSLYLHRMGRNLSGALRALHSSGYVIGDVNESNILATETALITLVDTDSFQVRDPQASKVYRCRVGRREFTPPELQGRVFQEADRLPEHDLFGLAVLLFQLLMEGTHPFAGVYQGTDDPPPYETRIQQGFFPSGTRRGPYRPMPAAPPFEILHPTLQRLFLECFEEGFTRPSARPTALQWQNALTLAEESLKTCAVNPQHRYGAHLSSCPWCERTRLLGGRDPFPSVSQVRQGKHYAQIKRKPTPVKDTPHVQAPVYGAYSSPIAPTPHFPTALVSFTRNRWAIATMFVGIFSMLPVYRVLLGVASIPCGLMAWRVARKMRGDGRGLATGGVVLGLTMCLLAWAIKLPRGTLFEMGKGISALAFTPNGKTLATATRKSEDNSERGGTVNLWDVDSEESSGTLGETFRGDVSGIVFSPNASYIATTSSGALETGHLTLLNSKGAPLWRKEAHRNVANAVAFSPDSKFVASGGSREFARTREVFSEVKLWSVPAGILQETWEGAGCVFALAFSPDGKLLAVGCGAAGGGAVFRSGERGRIDVYDTQTRKRLWTQGAHSTAVLAVAFLPKSDEIATVGNGNAISFWDAKTGVLRKSFTQESPKNSAVLYLPDGNTLITSGEDRKVSFWNLQTGKIVRQLTGHNAEIRALALTNSGDVLASGSLDGMIHLWHLNEPTQ